MRIASMSRRLVTLFWVSKWRMEVGVKATRCVLWSEKCADRDEADLESPSPHSLVRRNSTFTTRRVKSSILLGVSFRFPSDLSTFS